MEYTLDIKIGNWKYKKVFKSYRAYILCILSCIVITSWWVYLLLSIIPVLWKCIIGLL